MPSLTKFWIGRSLDNGRFLVTEKLGEGGMAIVFRGRDTTTETEVVIKVPKPELLREKAFRKRFAREAQTLRELKHPHVVEILHIGSENRWPFTVHPYLGGGDLEAMLQLAEGRLPFEEISAWLFPIARALDFIHHKGYLHRDVKPSNILFDGQGGAFLSDFGIAKVQSNNPSNATKLTGTGLVLGTPGYMAPELIMDKPLDDGLGGDLLSGFVPRCGQACELGH